MNPPTPNFDLTPNPRILAMLGEINLAQWKCVAELVDNAIDGFLRATREGAPVAHPHVSVHLPTAESSDAVVRAVDNGPGMSPEILENAVKAGWTGNDPINNLGLFGMGFNIATATFGRATTAWTTRSGDPEWIGVRVDFDELAQQGHFRTARLSRPKSDPEEHGTEIVIERLKPDQRQWLAKTSNQARVKTLLSQSYSAMLQPGGQPISFDLQVNGVRVKGRQHCVWGRPADGSTVREVIVGTGAGAQRVPTYIDLDHQLPPRPYCQACWQWLPSDATACSACGTADQVVQRPRRIYGWLGIQRYLHEDEYGIDLIRNGRKIEIQSKDLFSFIGDAGAELEYPIDDPRRRGRVVGEVHIDHCRVSYTKDRFDRSDPVWDEMVEAVRGRGPLRPQRAAELGLGGNTSPLYRLYQAFRRSQPHNRAMAGGFERLMLVPPEQNPNAIEMAKRYRDGVAEYRTDEKWFALVQEADNALLGGPAKNPSSAPAPGAPATSTAGVPGFGAGATIPAPAQSQPPRDPIPSLTREYTDPATHNRWDIKAFIADENDPGLGTPSRPWHLSFQADQDDHIFLVNPRHPAFRSITLTPLDALLAELAWSAADAARRTRGTASTFTESFASLRQAYGAANALDATDMNSDARGILRDITRRVDAALDSADRSALYAQLPSHDQRATMSAMLTRGVAAPPEAVMTHGFLEYLPAAGVIRFFDEHPDLFFDGRCWDEAFSTIQLPTDLAEEKQAEVKRRYGAMLGDVVWLAECTPEALERSTRERLLRAGMAVSALAPVG